MKYFSNSLAQHKGEPTAPPAPPAEPAEAAPAKELPGQGNKKEKPADAPPAKEDTSKLGFNAKKAADLTTSSRVDAVKAASETVRLQGNEERSNVKENADSVASATSDASKERNQNVDNYDYQRRGAAPKARDDLSWATHTKVGLA